MQTSEVNSIFNDENADVLLLIEVGNTYNSVNEKAIIHNDKQKATIHNVKVTCSGITIFVSNYSSSSPRLFTIGGYKR